MNYITRYRPWTAQHPLHEEFRQMLDRFFDNEESAGDQSNVVTSQWAPRVDIREEGRRFVIDADIPGVDPKDIEVHMDKGILSIRGERVLLGRGLHRPPDRVAARPAGGQRAPVAERALEAAERGERDATLVRLVVVVEQVPGHAPTLPRRRRPDIGLQPSIGHPDFSICGP